MVSVIIPYDKDRGYLADAIASVEAQTYTDWELLLQHGNWNKGRNINNGICREKGEFIKVLDEDDELMPDCLSILVEGIKGYDFVYADAENFGDLGAWPPRSHDATTNLEEMLRGNRIHCTTVLYSISALKEVGMYDESLWTAEEYDLHLRMLQKGYKHRHIPAIVCRYRLHSGNKSAGNREMRQEVIKQIRQRYV